MHTDLQKLARFFNPSVIAVCFETKEIMEGDLKHYTFNSNHICKAGAFYPRKYSCCHSQRIQPHITPFAALWINMWRV